MAQQLGMAPQLPGGSGGGVADPLSGLSRCLAALCHPGALVVAAGACPAAGQAVGQPKSRCLERTTTQCAARRLLVPPPASKKIPDPKAAPAAARPRGCCAAGAATQREEHALAAFVDAEGRSLSGDKLNRFLAELHARVRGLVASGDPAERLAGVLAIDELAQTRVFAQSPPRLSDLVKVLMEAFQAGAEVHTMRAAAATLGRLVRAGGPLMADVVEEQVGGRAPARRERA